jgi:hypothetical protein
VCVCASEERERRTSLFFHAKVKLIYHSRQNKLNAMGTNRERKKDERDGQGRKKKQGPSFFFLTSNLKPIIPLNPPFPSVPARRKCLYNEQKGEEGLSLGWERNCTIFNWTREKKFGKERRRKKENSFDNNEFVIARLETWLKPTAKLPSGKKVVVVERRRREVGRQGRWKKHYEGRRLRLRGVALIFPMWLTSPRDRHSRPLCLPRL